MSCFNQNRNVVFIFIFSLIFFLSPCYYLTQHFAWVLIIVAVSATVILTPLLSFMNLLKSPSWISCMKYWVFDTLQRIQCISYWLQVKSWKTSLHPWSSFWGSHSCPTSCTESCCKLWASPYFLQKVHNVQACQILCPQVKIAPHSGISSWESDQILKSFSLNDLDCSSAFQDHVLRIKTWFFPCCLGYTSHFQVPCVPDLSWILGKQSCR